MSIAEIFLTAIVVGFSGAIMPGPMLTVTINESVRRGAKAGPLIVFGHVILEFLLIIGLIFGLSGLLRKPTVTATIASAGGLFLLWTGISMMKSVVKGDVHFDLKSESSKKDFGPVASGLLTSLANPYWTMWWATVGLGYLTLSQKFGGIGIASFFTGHILADFTWYTFISFTVAKGRNFLSDKVYQGIISVCGIFLVFLAFTFIKEGLLRFGLI